MTIAIEMAANSYQTVAEKLNLPINKVKEDSRKLLQDTYVDNGTTGGSRTQVQRMLGTRLKDGTYSGTIPAMLKQVGLKIKTIVTSVSQDPEDLAKLSDKVLGCLYNPREDLLGIKFVFNPSKKKKGLKTKLDLNLQHIDSFYESLQSKGSTTSPRSIKKFSTIGLRNKSNLTFMTIVHTEIKVSKTEESNLETLPVDDFNDDNITYNHQTFDQILALKFRVEPFQDKKLIRRHQDVFAVIHNSTEIG